MANQHYANEFMDKALRAEISSNIITKKANVCPFAIRLAWHSSGTYDPNDTNNNGGSDGSTMRFTEESSDGGKYLTRNSNSSIVYIVLRIFNMFFHRHFFYDF